MDSIREILDAVKAENKPFWQVVLETDQQVSAVTREMVAEISGVERVTYYEKEAD